MSQKFNKIYTTEANFRNGIAKLTENIFKSMVPDENGKIVPFIEIPEEFDPRYPLVMTSINTVINNADIYALYMQDMHESALEFEREEGVLIGAIKDDTTTRAEMMKMLHCNNKLISATLCMELYKEIMDAVYYIAFEFCNSIISLTGLENTKSILFGNLVDIKEEKDMASFVRSAIINNVNATKNVFASDYTIFNYVYNLRQVLGAAFADHWYNTVRDFEYGIAIGNPNGYEMIGKIDVVTTEYLYALDQVLNIILTSFQPKVQFCYSHSFEMEKQLLDGTFNDESEE